MTKIYDIHSYKGGVGVTTTACSLALTLTEKGKVLLVDSGYSCDTYAWLGLGEPTHRKGEIHEGVFENLDIVRLGDSEKFPTVTAKTYDFVVIDNGRNSSQEFPTDFITERVCVVRNDYLTLRNTANRFAKSELLVAFVTEGAALTARDICSVLGREPVEALVNNNSQRAIDAGLAPMRLKTQFGWASSLAE